MAKLERTSKQAKLIAEELSSGVLGIPEIQRDYVWREGQAIDLIDSMYKQYPTGLILLWKPTILPKLRTRNDITPNYLILDGQQRITSLEKIFSGEIKILFDIEKEIFQKYTLKSSLSQNLIPVNDILEDMYPIAERIKEDIHLDNSDIYKRLDNVRRIGDYEFPVMIMNTDNYHEVTESFIRLNSKGTVLRTTELAMAKLAFNWPGSIIEKFDTALDEFEDIGFSFNPSFLMRCFLAIGHGKSNTFNNLNKIWEMDEVKLNLIWKETKKSIERSITFLKNNAGIESKKWIKSENTIITLSYFFHKKGSIKISEREINGLLLWFFVTLVFGRYSGKVALVDKDIKALKSNDPIIGLLDNLKHDISSFKVTNEMIKGSYYHSKLLPLIFTIIKNRNAKDWFTGISLSIDSIGTNNKVQKHHIFPTNYMKKNGYTGREKMTEVNDISNIAFLSQEANRSILDEKPEIYLPKIEKQRLEDQFIPNYAEMWKVERYSDFCYERRELIAQEINLYFSKLYEKIYPL